MKFFRGLKYKIRQTFVFEPLAFLTKLVIDKRKTKVVGVTGSLGKTTTTTFIYSVLKTKYPNVYISKDLTTGVPTYLSIFGYSPVRELRKQFLGLFYVFFKVLWILLNKRVRFWSHLVLELRCHFAGNNLAFLTTKLQPDIRIVTAIEIVHAESLGGLSEIASKKRALVECGCLDTHNALLNVDDPYVKDMAKCTVAKIIFYGFGEKADAKVSDVSIDETGLSFLFNEKNNEPINFKVPKIFDKAHIYAILPAILVGRIYNMNWDEVIDAVSKIEPVEGRGNIVAGIKNSLIINNTFNANVRSMTAALKSLASFPKDRRRIAILGNILELHKFSDLCHREIGKVISSDMLNFLVTIGDDAAKIAEEAVQNGFDVKRTLHFNDVDQALGKIKDMVSEKDIILIKASHGMNLMKIVNALKSEK